MTLDPRHVFHDGVRPESGNKGRPAAEAGLFVITLCSVAKPITIPQPRSPQLARFRFFLSHGWEGNRKRYTLHMGHFSTLAEARKWLTILRGIYPSAFVREGPATQADSLSDTQVLSILEECCAECVVRGADETAGARSISLLRPDDTSTRLALRDAVTRDASVSFAVQLQSSAEPINLGKAPRHAIFSSYTLYTAQAHLEGRQWFCLRLGFFSDAISAKQVAQYLFSDFPSVAVVPVNVLEEFNRYNRRQLVVEDRELGDFRISGVYSSTDPSSLIRFIRAQPGMRVEESDSEVRITTDRRH
jgi:hypothetical protein